MSLLSRFRKTVTPSKSKLGSDTKRSAQQSTREKTTSVTDNDHHNYRKSTKSFNEKSLKPKNTYHSYMNSDDDDHHHHHYGRRSSSTNHHTNSMAIPKSSVHSVREKNSKSFDTPPLQRSDTFTLEEENELQNGSYPHYKSRDNERYDNNHYDVDEYKSDTNRTKNSGKEIKYNYFCFRN